MIAFITTSEIFHMFPLEDTDILVGTWGNLTVYSTGKLEKLLADGKRPVVLSSRSRRMDHDEWWASLVPEEDIHFLPPEETGDGNSVTRFFKRVVEQVYGLPWPVSPTTEPLFWTSALNEINQLKQEKA